MAKEKIKVTLKEGYVFQADFINLNVSTAGGVKADGTKEPAKKVECFIRVNRFGTPTAELVETILPVTVKKADVKKALEDLDGRTITEEAVWKDVNTSGDVEGGPNTTGKYGWETIGKMFKVV